MPEEFFPLGVAGDVVLLRWAQRPPPGYERAVPVDGLFGVDGLIAHGGVHVAMPDDQRSDVRRQAVHETGREQYSDHAEYLSRSGQPEGYSLGW
jgi:hypothetical protein